ncbi:hypothetical protein BGX31_003341, partial [Mortierella sp. GBA43]
MAGLMVSDVVLAAYYFRMRQDASETDPQLTTGWYSTASIVSGSILLPCYLYSSFVKTSIHTCIRYTILWFLAIFNIAV